MIQIPASAPFVLLLFLGAPVAGAQQGTPPENRPAYAFLRQVENWSKFMAAAPATDIFDPLKHIEFSDDGFYWASFGGRVEARYEEWRDFGFNSPDNDDFLVARALLHAELHAGEHLRLFVEGKTAQASHRDLPGGRRPLDYDVLALQQAFVDIVLPMGDSTLTLRPGRQMLLLGNQRLVSPLPWGNALRAWDGLTAEWKGGGWSVTGIAAAFAPVQQMKFNDTDEDNTLFGLYARRAPAAGGRGLELYALGNGRENVTVNGTTGDEKRQTWGARVWGPISGPTDYEVEGAWQTGEVGEGNVNAWFLAAQAGWKTGKSPKAPRLWLGLDLASGDDEPGGGVGTFHQLFPLGHAYFGYIDMIGRQNIMDFSAGSKCKLNETTGCSFGFHVFRLMEGSDAIYNAGGDLAFSAPAGGFDSKDVGMEADVVIDHRWGRHWDSYVGYSHFFPGEAVKQASSAEDIDFVYLGLKFTF
jgi:hypothetical protein